MTLSTEKIGEFASYLHREEKSGATQEKYLRDVRAFCVYAGDNVITKELVVAWKKHLMEKGYAVRSINSMLASVNSLLEFLGLPVCRVKKIRIQRQTYCAEDKELTKAEYLRLLAASKKDEQLNRSNIRSAMKKLCEAVKVKPSKVFPHNLRKLFARTFYRIEKDTAVSILSASIS